VWIPIVGQIPVGVAQRVLGAAALVSGLAGCQVTLPLPREVVAPPITFRQVPDPGCGYR